MRITRSTLRRLIAEESARLLREAAEEESTATNEAERGKKGKKRGGADCLYVLYGGRGVYYYTAPCGLSEEEAAEKGHDVSADVADGEDMADPLSLYDWLQRHDEITAVYDDESAGGEVSKEDFMEQLRGVGEEEGLFASDDDVNEGDEPLDEMEDQEYNEYLQQQHGRFTTPENVKGTPEYAAKHRQPSAPRHSQEPSRGSVFGGGYDYSEYDHLMREGGPGDDFLDYDPEEIPDMDDQYDPDYYEGQDDEEDDYYGDDDPFGDDEAIEKGYEYVPGVGYKKPGDDSWMDIETGDDDIPYGAADVALRMGRGHRTDESKAHGKVSPRKRLEAWLDKSGVEASTVMSAIDKALAYAHEETGEAPTSEDVTFNLSDRVLDALPEDEDDKWHSMIDAVLKDEFDADAFADAEAYRKDIEDTERDLSHPSRFLEEGDDDSQGDDDMGYEDDADYEHAYSMGGGSDEEGFAIDYDVGRPSPFAAKMFGQPAAGADDIEGADADEDVFGDDDMGLRGAIDDYHHAYKLGGGRDEEGFAADYDTGKKRQFPPARGGLSEARWAKLAGILKG